MRARLSPTGEHDKNEKVNPKKRWGSCTQPHLDSNPEFIVKTSEIKGKDVQRHCLGLDRRSNPKTCQIRSDLLHQHLPLPSVIHPSKIFSNPIPTTRRMDLIELFLGSVIRTSVQTLRTLLDVSVRVGATILETPATESTVTVTTCHRKASLEVQYCRGASRALQGQDILNYMQLLPVHTSLQIRSPSSGYFSL